MNCSSEINFGEPGEPMFHVHVAINETAFNDIRNTVTNLAVRQYPLALLYIDRYVHAENFNS
jgi:hypothetical protein